MKKYPLFRIFWFVVNVFLVVSLGAVLYSFAWEFSTRNYLKGFSDAIIPADDSTAQKAEAILAWMSHGPGRRSDADPNAAGTRDPENTLNFQQLLQVCGTATNAFVNLADSSGMHTRRLLLMNEAGFSKHVVVEVLIDGRWIVVDPAYRSVFRRRNGDMVTRTELADPAVFREVTEPIPGYPADYTYERTVHVRMRRIPLVGRYLRRIFTFVWPRWEEAIDWTLLVERESFAMLIASSLLLCFSLAARLLLGWYCAMRLGIPRTRMRDQIVRAGEVLVGSSK